MLTQDIVSTVVSKFDFDINKFKLSGPDNMSTNLYGLFRSDNAECISKQSVTKQYVPHTTDDVLALVEAGANAFEGEINVDCYFRGGHYVNLMPTKEDRLEVYKNDGVIPRIIVNASYNGRAFTATMGFWRDLCSNMSVLRSVDSTTVSIRHSSGLRLEMDELIEQFGVLKESWGDLSAAILNMQSRQVVISEILKEVYGEPEKDTGRGATIHKNRTESIVRRILSEQARTGRPAPTNGMVSAWEMFNGIQGYVQHDSTRKGTVTDFSRIIDASNDRAVKKAETLLVA